jgi:DNA-binding IclR family transcriptional regulator
MPTRRQPFFPRGEWCRTQVLGALAKLNRPAGHEEIRRTSKVPDAFASHALLQLEVKGLVVREPNPRRVGFLWRIR